MSCWRSLLIAGGIATLACRQEGRPCQLGETRLEFVTGSELESSAPYQLALQPGRTADCNASEFAAARTSITRALQRFPVRIERLVVHVEPRLPQDQAAVNGIEVHVGSRQVLVTTDALSTLPARAWVHELAHVVAQEPPSKRISARIALTVEEAFAQAVEERLLDRRTGHETPNYDAESAPWELLAETGYDPHVLAAPLAAALRQDTRLGVADLLSCLKGSGRSAHSEPTTVGATLVHFVQGCDEAARPVVHRVLVNWVPASLVPEL